MTDIYNEARWMALSKIDGLGAAGARLLVERFGDTMGVFEAEKEEILEIDFLKPEVVEELAEITGIDPVSEYMRLRDAGIDYYSMEHPLYPKRLRLIDSPPIGLFVKGKLPAEGRKAAAIVGSRTCSSYGRTACDLFCKEFAREKIDVISGMAIGIDACAHQSALAGGGKTYAVLGCGVDVCYPMANYTLYEQIIETGGVISEFYPGTKPIAMRFPMRNRIIAGLSDAVLAVEARRKSGTLITVGCALNQGKEVYSIPGRLTDKLSEGCNGLIAIGARIALSPKEMADDIKKTAFEETAALSCKTAFKEAVSLSSKTSFEQTDTLSGKAKISRDEGEGDGFETPGFGASEKRCTSAFMSEDGISTNVKEGARRSLKGINKYKQATLFDKQAKEADISSEDAKKVFLATDVTATTVVEIAEKTGFDIGKLMGILGSLELDGFIRQEGPGAYARVLMG
jgi:DNA processing protein